MAAFSVVHFLSSKPPVLVDLKLFLSSLVSVITLSIKGIFFCVPFYGFTFIKLSHSSLSASVGRDVTSLLHTTKIVVMQRKRHAADLQLIVIHQNKNGGK